MLKKILFIILIIIIAIAVLIISKPYGYSTNEISKSINFDVSSCIVETDKDTHDGWLGDGEYYAKLNCSEISETIINKIESWNKLPLSENLQLIMYAEEKDGKIYNYKLAKKAGIPEIKNGYYLFIDRHSDAIDVHSDKELFNRYSYNFTIAFYDLDTNYLYYYKYDT